MVPRVQRSMLIMPLNVPRFIEKAYLRGSDAILLDLEDAVPPSEKEAARGRITESVALAGRGGADVLIRINNESDFIDKDLEASVVPGVSAIFVPKVESAEQVVQVEALIAHYEEERGLARGSIGLSVHIESPIGVLRLAEIASAGARIESMSLGVDDYCLELGVEPSRDAAELFFPLNMMAVVCRAHGISPIGLMGSVADFGDVQGFELSARRTRALGFMGAYCIHPDQVPILNRVYSPDPQEVEHARRVAEAFEAGLRKGRASVNLDGKMVDTPIYKQALRMLDRFRAVREKEALKARALGTVGP